MGRWCGAGLAALVASAGLAPTARAGGDGPAPANAEVVAIVNGKEAPVPAIPMGDPATIEAVLRLAKDDNRVMEHLTVLTKELGPRLTGSSKLQKANEWARDRFAEWGLSNPRLEKWGEVAVRFDRGPSSGKVLLRDERKGQDGEVKVEYRKLRDMELSTLSWTAGTNGPVRGPVVRMPRSEAEYNEVRERIKGSYVLVQASAPVGQRGVRRQLQEAYQNRLEIRAKVESGTPVSELPWQERIVFDGPAGYIGTSRDERVWTGAINGWREKEFEKIPTDVHAVVRLSDYDYINSRLADDEPIEIELDLQHTLTKGPFPVYNTIAEIRGSEKPDEYVIVSAHLDSWDGPGSQGATDNGTGSAVTMEAARLLMAAGAKPKRTILFILWTGEEQGLLGAREWVKANEALWPKISACFVDDGGTNYQGGLPAADVMVDYLAAATAPLNNRFFDEVDQKSLNINIRPTGAKLQSHSGSDHAAFNAVGVPGFFWDEEGRADYGFGWHTQHDRLELAIPSYLKQSAASSAITAYNLACAPELLPRPKPETKNEEKKEEKQEQPQATPQGL